MSSTIDWESYGPAAGSLRRSLSRNRVGHAYLLGGARLESLETLAFAWSVGLLCEERAPDADHGCGVCESCRRSLEGKHPDLLSLRPASKLREIRLEPMRELMRDVQLKPLMGRRKVAVICGADRMNVHAANAFLKTLEEPPPGSVFLLLSQDFDSVMDTIRSRCLVLRLRDPHVGSISEDESAYIGAFADFLSGSGLLARYRAIDRLMSWLGAIREQLEATTVAVDEQAGDLDAKERALQEAERQAAIEAEYRRLRGGVLESVTYWMRDAWLCSMGIAPERWRFGALAEVTKTFAAPRDTDGLRRNVEALEALQRLLRSNVQEALAIEVALLGLK